MRAELLPCNLQLEKENPRTIGGGALNRAARMRVSPEAIGSAMLQSRGWGTLNRGSAKLIQMGVGESHLMLA